MFSFRVHSDLMDEVRALAVHTGVTNAAVVNVMLRAGLRAHGAQLLAMTTVPRRGDRP